MHPKRFNSEAAHRAADRRLREDEAPRLLAMVPQLSGLQIAFTDGEDGALAGIAHLRHVVIGRAPALFEQPCGNSACKGEHQLTRELMAGLRRRDVRIEGTDRCLSPVGSGSCRWVLRYVATARYQAPA